jgi:hypothetical protein
MNKTSLIAFAVLTASAAQFATAKGASPVTCSPAEVHAGDTVTIKTNKPFRYLAFKAPGKQGQTEMLVYPIYQGSAEDSAGLLMNSEAFSKGRSASVDVSKAKFRKAGATGPATNVVFDKPGTYTFMVSENMETDDGTPTYECKVKYAAK